MRDQGNPLGTLDEIEACLLHRMRRLEPSDVVDFQKLPKDELIHLWREGTKAIRDRRPIPPYCTIVFSAALLACVENPRAVIPLLAQRVRGRPKKSTQRVDPPRWVNENFAVTAIEAAGGTGPSIEELAARLMPNNPELRARWVKDLRERAGFKGTDTSGTPPRGQGSDRENVLEKQAEVLGVSTRTLERIVRLRRQKSTE